MSLFLTFSLTLTGQNKPLDNWDLETLNKKDLQSETYFSFTKRGSFKSLTASTLLRYGIQKNIELQVTWTGTREKSDFIFGDKSSQSARVGIKAFINNDTKYLPGFSVIGSINLTPDPKKNPISPALNILFRKGIAKNFALTGNYQFILDEQHGDLSSDFAVNLDVELTNWLTSYVGITGDKSYPFPDAQSISNQYVELGMLLWVADGFRIYPYYDFGLGDESDDILNIGILYFFK